MALPERQAYTHFYKTFDALLKKLSTPAWKEAYVSFELALLEELGYGLNMKACAVTGERDDLVAVSPRTGRAVCRRVAEPYQNKLLPLPAFLATSDEEIQPKPQEILDAMRLSGYFLERYLLGRDLPAARERLVQVLNQTRNDG
jgi:DNA repair protein RecO (recombination protein O)